MGLYVFAVPFIDGQVVFPKVDGEQIQYSYPTGEKVMRTQKDAVYEDRPILDEHGDPTEKTESVFSGWGEPYQEEVDEIKGGYSLLSPTYKGNNTLALVAIRTTPAIRDLFSNTDWAFLYEEIEDGNQN